jgi:hypothetical protein
VSANAYREVYGQEPPAGAHFGADISWWQGTDIWADLVNWAEWVTIRCSYGNSSEDGREEAHVAAANAYGYSGKLGGYHFYYAGDPVAQANNYLYQSSNIRGQFSHHMVDAEATPVADIGQLETWCDIVGAATGQPTFAVIYSGWSYLNGSGPTDRQIWLPHYASSRYTAWNGTPGSWDTYNAPWTPDWYGQRNPAIWQYASLTGTHGHLDLNVGTDEAAQLLGLGGSTSEEDLTPELKAFLDAILNNVNGLPGWIQDSRNEVATHTSGVYTRIQQEQDLLSARIGQAQDALSARIGQAQDGLSVQLRRSTRMRLIQAKNGWWVTDLIGVVPVPNPEFVKALASLGYFNNDVDPDGNPVPQVWPDETFEKLVRYDLQVPTGPPVLDVEKSLKQATTAQLIEELKAKLKDQTATPEVAA